MAVIARGQFPGQVHPFRGASFPAARGLLRHRDPPASQSHLQARPGPRAPFLAQALTCPAGALRGAAPRELPELNDPARARSHTKYREVKSTAASFPVFYFPRAKKRPKVKPLIFSIRDTLRPKCPQGARCR